MTYKEIEANIWDFKDEIKVVTVNGNIKKIKTKVFDGHSSYRAVMGKGLALQAAQRFPNLPELLANEIMNDKENGCFYFKDYKIITFPTKVNFWEKSSYELIRQSMEELYQLCDVYDIRKVIMPRVGCSNGQLDWQRVKNRIIDILEQVDIEFVIVRI